MRKTSDIAILQPDARIAAVHMTYAEATMVVDDGAMQRFSRRNPPRTNVMSDDSASACGPQASRCCDRPGIAASSIPPQRKCSSKPPARLELPCLFSYLVNRTVEDGSGRNSETAARPAVLYLAPVSGTPGLDSSRSCPAPKHTAQRHLPNECLSWVSLCRRSPVASVPPTSVSARTSVLSHRSGSQTPAVMKWCN